MESVQSRACNVCSGVSHKVLYTKGDLTYNICTSCGFVFLATVVSSDALKTFYESGYEHVRHGISEYDAAVERLLKKGSYERKRWRLEDFRPYINSDSVVLEIGSGYGTFLKVLKDSFGATVRGIEPGSIGAKVAREYYELTVYEGTLESALLNNKEQYVGMFDCVLMIHVLEHLGSPLEKLLNIRTLLKKDGVLYIAVPNIMRPDEALEKFFHIEHLSYFSPYTLELILQKAGFRMVSVLERDRELVIVVKLSDSEGSVRLDSRYLPENIMRVISAHKQKYTLLRYLKYLVAMVLPQKFQKRCITLASGFLRKIGFIRV